MKTIRDFMELLVKTKNTSASVILETWKELIPKDEWEKCIAEPLSSEGILALRNQISEQFAEQVRGARSTEFYNMLRNDHTDFIREFDTIAEDLGYPITQAIPPLSVLDVVCAHEDQVEDFLKKELSRLDVPIV